MCFLDYLTFWKRGPFGNRLVCGILTLRAQLSNSLIRPSWANPNETIHNAAENKPITINRESHSDQWCLRFTTIGQSANARNFNVCSDWLIIQWARKLFPRRVDVSRLIQCRGKKLVWRLESVTQESYSFPSTIYIFFREKQYGFGWRVSKTFFGVIFSAVIVVLFFVEHQLAMKLINERIINGG